MIIKLTCLTKDLPLNNPNVIILQRIDKGEVKCMDTSCISDPVKCNTHNQKRTLSCKYPKGCHAMTCSITKTVTATLVVWDVSDRKMNTCERYGESCNSQSENHCFSCHLQELLSATEDPKFYLRMQHHITSASSKQTPSNRR